MPRLSILIPALGDPQDFESTLASVLQNRPRDVEILLAHAAEYHDPYKLAGEVCFLPVPEANTIAGLLNAGFEAARSRIVHVLQCGHQVEEGWIEPALPLLDDERVASVAPIVVDATGKQIVSTGLGYSRLGRPYSLGRGKRLADRAKLVNKSVGPLLSAGFYRRSWWRRVRWDESIGDRFAAAQYNLTLAELGAHTQVATDCVIWQEESLDLAKVEPLGYAEARHAELLYWLHSGKAPRATTYLGRTLLALVESTFAIPNVRSVTGLLGRVAGMMARGQVRQFRKRLAEIAEEMLLEQNESRSDTLSLDDARQQKANGRTSKRRAA